MRIRHQFYRPGQSLVEFALIFPILILIILFIVDLGRVVYIYSELSNISRTVARYGIIYAAQNPDENEGQVYNNISPKICASAFGLDIGCPNPTMVVNLIDFDSNGRNDEINIQISSGFSPVTPLVGSFLELDENHQIVISSQSTMRIEHQAEGNTMKNLFKFSEKGQSSVLIIAMLFGILALLALVIDGGNGYLKRRQAQSVC